MSSSTSSELATLREAARVCTACDLYRNATQTVFGEGPARARILMVGEQPGNDEDLAGRPFVGPAGRVLDEALAEAGIDRELTWVTNVVKHFKWEARGKRRIHAKPNAAEVKACLPWLEAEVRTIQPDIVVCLGATAAQALLGRTFRVTASHGQILPWQPVPAIMATVHPSSILRATDSTARELAMRGFTDDLRRLSDWLRTSAR